MPTHTADIQLLIVRVGRRHVIVTNHRPAREPTALGWRVVLRAVLFCPTCHMDKCNSVTKDSLNRNNTKQDFPHKVQHFFTITFFKKLNRIYDRGKRLKETKRHTDGHLFGNKTNIKTLSTKTRPITQNNIRPHNSAEEKPKVPPL